MSYLANKISLGFVIYLSAFLLGSQSSFAVSLQIGDRQNSSLLKQQLDFSQNFFSSSDSIETDFLQKDKSVLLQVDAATNQKILKLFVLNDKQLSSVYSTQSIPISESDISSSQSQKSLFNLDTITEKDRLEETDLLGYIADSLDNLEFETTRNNSSSEPSITILTQSSVQDIYEGVYSFEIDLSAADSIFPEEIDDSAVANDTLQEESSSTSNVADSSDLRSFAYVPYNSSFLPRNSYFGSLIGSSNVDSLIQSLANLASSENLSSEIEGLLPITNNAGAYTDTPEVERQTNYDFSRSRMSGIKKDPKMKEIEQKIKEEQQRRKEERRRLQQQLLREQQQKERQRIQQQRNLERQRKEKFQRRLREQQEAMRRRAN